MRQGDSNKDEQLAIIHSSITIITTGDYAISSESSHLAMMAQHLGCATERVWVHEDKESD